MSYFKFRFLAKTNPQYLGGAHGASYIVLQFRRLFSLQVSSKRCFSVLVKLLQNAALMKCDSKSPDNTHTESEMSLHHVLNSMGFTFAHNSVDQRANVISCVTVHDSHDSDSSTSSPLSPKRLPNFVENPSHLSKSTAVVMPSVKSQPGESSSQGQ